MNKWTIGTCALILAVGVGTAQPAYSRGASKPAPSTPVALKLNYPTELALYKAMRTKFLNEYPGLNDQWQKAYDSAKNIYIDPTLVDRDLLDKIGSLRDGAMTLLYLNKLEPSLAYSKVGQILQLNFYLSLVKDRLATSKLPQAIRNDLLKQASDFVGAVVKVAGPQ